MASYFVARFIKAVFTKWFTSMLLGSSVDENASSTSPSSKSVTLEVEQDEDQQNTIKEAFEPKRVPDTQVRITFNSHKLTAI